MKSALILTVIGPDRPGLVESLAAAVAEHGGNWEQSRMARLGGQFAGIVKVSAPAASIAALRSALEALSSRGLRVISDAAEAQPAVSLRKQRAFHLEVVGNDREGIVREVARVLAEQHVNVEELDTSCESAPMAGGMLFHADALVNIPESVDLDQLRKRLEAIADDLMVDVQLLPKSEP